MIIAEGALVNGAANAPPPWLGWVAECSAYVRVGGGAVPPGRGVGDRHGCSGVPQITRVPC